MDNPAETGADFVPPFDKMTDTAITNSTGPGITASIPIILRILPLEFRLLASALFIIWVGAHASLKRPPSAAPTTVTRTGKPLRKVKKREEEDTFTQGLLPSDAIMFPVMAGIVLVGLYYLIQWLQDPAILNKILNVYMTVGGLMSLSAFFAYFIQRGVHLVFPNFIRRNGIVYEFDTVNEIIRPVQPADSTKSGVQDGPIEPAQGPSSPFPFRFFGTSNQNQNALLWELRHLLTEDWKVKLNIHNVVAEKFNFQFSSLLGAVGAVIVVAFYLATGSKPLSNLMGLGFCFGSFQFLSPTTFTTGGLVLSGLFVYDIVMVFFTPFMITVATKIDAPIKLTFEGAGRASMLGLGDIVIPGMVMALALRFDLWRYYENKTTYVPTELTTDLDSGATTTEICHIAKKKPYMDVTGRSGDRFWLSSWMGIFSKPKDDCPEVIRASGFSKTYFYASMIGYTLGMIVTLIVLIIFKHGQPALLYLVPGVLGSLWITGFVRGELKDMWIYTEDGSLDTEDVVVELDGDGNVIKVIDDKEKKLGDEDETKKDKKKDEAEQAKKSAEMRAKGYDLYHFSVRAPPRGGEQEVEVGDKEKSA
ncbi:signal peptide peptidase family protein [Plectosphaerella plurivora]|uniref:Signal peptide peptidase family protein n=1 Tax=Plectosphaerella plurivora TaxID=936078 RepID=A0A9P9AHA0_9PEZI|nr:signal peptide peptidase family protein [Plectosphaerella plurivora]